MEMASALSRLPPTVKVLWKLSQTEVPDQASLDALNLTRNIKVGRPYLGLDCQGEKP